jgi:hypothetical protein
MEVKHVPKLSFIDVDWDTSAYSAYSGGGVVTGFGISAYSSYDLSWLESYAPVFNSFD